ncbi:MAG: ATP-binding protein [Acidobacteriota bacterium]|nr:ATP-binding protein [Acidobacteriota bacterium]
MNRKKRVKREAAGVARGGGTLRHELAGYLRDKSQVLQDRWVRQMKVHDLLRDTPLPELEAGFTALHNIFVDCLETGEYEAARSVARSMAPPVGRGRITTDRIIDSLLALRDVYWRSLFEKYQADVELLAAALDLCFSVADRLLAPVVLSLGVEQATASQQEIRQLRMLVKTGMVLNAKLSLPAVLQRIANMACKLVGAQYGALGVVDGKGGLSQFITAGIDEKTKKAIGPLPVGKGILGVLVHEAKPLRLKDLGTDLRAHGFPANHPPMRSFMGVPVVSRGKVFGNLYLTEKQGAEEFSEADEAVAMTLAVQAAIAIENAGLYEELHRSYQELKRSQDLLLRQEKLASLGRLAAGLAHELNNPLNTAAGFVEALQGRSRAESLQANKEFEDFPRFLRMVQTEVDRAAAIVRRLLDFARQREPSLELVDLGTLISKSVAFVDRQAVVANQRIIVEPPRMPVWVRADALMLQQLLLNLLTNALDALEDSGEIRLAVGSISARQGSPRQAAMAILSIADNGCGIALENLTKIFDPFFTTKDVGKGTGLGLPVCLSIVEQHEGTIEVKSEGVGKGTTVIVKLPIGEQVGD